MCVNRWQIRLACLTKKGLLYVVCNSDVFGLCLVMANCCLYFFSFFRGNEPTKKVSDVSKLNGGGQVLVGRFELPCDEDLADSSFHCSFHCSTCGSTTGSNAGSNAGSVPNMSHHPSARNVVSVKNNEMTELV